MTPLQRKGVEEPTAVTQTNNPNPAAEGGSPIPNKSKVIRVQKPIPRRRKGDQPIQIRKGKGRLPMIQKR